MTKNIEGFKKKDFGAIIYRAIAYCLAICGILLLIQKNIASDTLFLGIKIFTLLIGIGLLFCFFFNARTRFRPGWTLPMAFVLGMAGGGSLALDIFSKSYVPSIGVSSVVILLFAVNGVLLLSTGIQQKYLCLKRWVVLILLGVMSLSACILIFLNVSLIREYPLTTVALFMFMLSLQSKSDRSHVVL